MENFAQTLQKYEERVAKTNHVDGKQLAMNYLFPLLRKLAGSVGEALAEHEEAISDLEDMIQNDGDTLAQARDVIMVLSSLLDETMVAAGFYESTAEGLKDTGKAPQELRERFVAAATQVVGVMQAIEEELNGEDEEDEVESDGADGEGARGKSAGDGAGAVAAVAAAGSAGAAKAREPDAVLDGDNATGGASAAALAAAATAAEAKGANDAA